MRGIEKKDFKRRGRGEDIKLRKENEKSSTFLSAIKHGVESAKNMAVLQWNDLLNESDKNDIAGEKARQRFGTELDTNTVEKKEQKVGNREEVMKIYAEQERKNRAEYEIFYNNLGDDTFQKVSSQLMYGATSSLLNPIEFTKNMAINATVSAFMGPLGFVSNFGANILADTVDNYYSNTWEDDLLGLERESSEKIVQAVGGALISNAVFPIISFSGKKLVGGLVEGMSLKGKTVNTEILNPTVTKQYRAELSKTNAVDLSHRDFKIANSVKKEVIKQQPIEEGLERVFTKQEIKNNIIRERTGIEPGIIDYNEGRKQLFVIADRIESSGEKVQAKSKKDIGLTEAELSSNASIGKMAEDWTNAYFVAPYMVTKDGYKVETIKSMKNMHPMFSDTLGMTFKGQGYNDLLGDSLNEKSVTKTLIYSMQNGRKQEWFIPKNMEEWDIKALKNYSYKKQNDFRQSIENGITYNPLENEMLLKSTPKYYKYFSDTREIGIFKKEISEVFSDWENKKITYSELASVLEGKRSRYEIMALKSDTGAEISYRDFLSEIKGKNINIDKLTSDIELIKQRKVDTATVKLMINKQRILDDFGTKDNKTMAKLLGEKIYNLREVAEGMPFDETYQKKLWGKLTETTKDVKEIVSDLKEMSLEEGNLKEYDLMKFIDDFFIGETREDKIASFLDFSEPYLRDNYDMLNIMDKLIMNEQASISTWGVPFKVVEDIVENHGSLLDVFKDIPALRKSFADGSISNKDFASHHGYKTVDDVIMQKLTNFVKSEKIFPEHKDKNILIHMADGSLAFTRWALLFWSGIKETFQHPILASVKAMKYGGTLASGIATAPISAVATLYKTLEPIAGTSVHLHKLYKGLGDLIAGDYSDELALMELGVNAKMLFGKGEVSYPKKIGGVLNNASLFIQNSMQKNRYLASRIVGINTIRKYLKVGSFEHLKPSTKKMLSSLGISDDIKFKEWKQEIQADPNGLKKALYENGFSDKTKKIHELLTRNSYEEDPMSPMRINTETNDYVAKVKLMFTNYNRSILKYYGDAIQFAEMEDGTYINRFSFEAMSQNTKDLGAGVKGLAALGLAGIAGVYLNSKMLGDSQDEKLKAQVKSALQGNQDSVMGLIQEVVESALPIDIFYQKRGGSPIYSAGKRLYQGVTGDYAKIAPAKLETFTRMLTGNKEYKKYSGMNRQEKHIYQKLALEDKAKSGSLVDYVLAHIITDEMVSEGELSAIDALEIKRQHGYNDKEILKSLEERGLKSVQKYAVINGETEDEILSLLHEGADIITEKNMNEKEIVETLDEANDYYHDMDRFNKEGEVLILTDEEEEVIRKYTLELEEQGLDALEIMEKVTILENKIYQNKKRKVIENV